MKTGDTVKHLPSGKKWKLAWARKGRVSPCTWPDLVVDETDCQLIEECSEADSIDLMRVLAAGCGSMQKSAECRDLLIEIELAAGFDRIAMGM